jgi:hypothetical protein
MLPEFDICILTVRSGSHTVRVAAQDAASARNQIQAECEAGEHHCPPEWCTDDIESTILRVREVVLDNVTIIAAGGVGRGTLYSDDTLRVKGDQPL